MANEAKPVFRPGAEVSVKASGANITGSTFVTAAGTDSGGQILATVASSAGPALGVAARDIKQNEIGSVIRGGILPVTSTGAISAGARVQVGSDGKAAAYSSGVAVGLAISAAANNVVLIALDL